MLAATVLTLLLVNLESMTSKPYSGGGSKGCVTWKVEGAVHNVVHADNVITDPSTDWGNELSHIGRGGAPAQPPF